MTPSQNPHLIDLAQLENHLHDLAYQRQEISIRLEFNGKFRPEHLSTLSNVM